MENTNNNETTNLRQADSILKLEGIISEKELELTTDNEGKEIIKGSITIQTSDINFVSVQVYMNKITEKGKENKAFKGMQTVLDTYKSIAEVGIEEATRVRITKGQISPNTYFDDKGQHDLVRFQSNYFNSVKNTDELSPKAEFEIEIFIQSIGDEVNSENETTGRVLIHGLLPTYNGIEPITLVAPQEIADAVSNAFDVGQTAKFFGEVINNRVVKTVEIPVAIGKPQVKTTTSYKNEFVITGASVPYEEGVGTPLPYELEAIKKAMAERDIHLEEMKNKASGNANNKAAQQTTKAKPASNRSLPF